MTLADRRPLTNAYEPSPPAVRRRSICGAGLGFGLQSSQTGSQQTLLEPFQHCLSITEGFPCGFRMIITITQLILSEDRQGQADRSLTVVVLRLRRHF